MLSSQTDLDDLDEELVDPDDDPSQQAPAASAPAPALQPAGGPISAGSAPAPGQNFNFQGEAGPSGQAAGPGGADQGDLDRIRPSDMPDEGLVLFPLPYLCRVGRVVGVSVVPNLRGQRDKRRSTAVSHSAIAISPSSPPHPRIAPLDRHCRRRQTNTDTLSFLVPFYPFPECTLYPRPYHPACWFVCS